MIPVEGTFEYVAVVPEVRSGIFSCIADSFKPIPMPRSRLVGIRPELQISDAGPTPNPSPRNPATNRSQITLVAQGKDRATIAKVSFLVDRGVISALRAGDQLHLGRTGCGRIGVSAIRDQELIFSVGAVTAVPQGNDFHAQSPLDLSLEAEEIFKKRDSSFEFSEYPIEFRAGDEQRIRYGGWLTLGAFEVWMLHGRRNGMPGTDECVSVVRRGSCQIVDANTSALFLDTDTIAMVRW